MRIIGVDPGNAVTGFGVVERRDAMTYIAAGAIRGNGMPRGPGRLAALYQRLLNVIDEYAPEAMSLERSFVAANVQSAFALGEARAVAMLAAAHRNIAVFEYMPTDVKLTVAGYGRADKVQVKRMVRQTLVLDETVTLTDDASDALAIALCHLFRARMGQAIRDAAGRA
ncbi:MAG: crossover junction endodeoxyribonuclease RuvC [Candidatus Binataceae bacterium]